MFYFNTDFRILTIIYLLISTCFAWENLPQIPTGRRSQYYLIQSDGGYKYGYDTGVNSAAKQSASALNEVEGHYFYTAPTGQKIDLKYTSGTQGFIPQTVGVLPTPFSTGIPSVPPLILPQVAVARTGDDSNGANGDASYSFNVDTDTYKRQESADSLGNVQGRYSYSNAAGTHDLSYIAGSNTGFVATSGSLATPNGLGGDIPTVPVVPLIPTSQAAVARSDQSEVNGPNADGSYSFSYSTGDSNRQESADAAGNVQGRFAYTDNAGNHDLNYIAGSGTGFLVTGGSLATPNGLGQGTPTVSSTGVFVAKSGGDAHLNGPTSDGSYSFSYNTGDSSRQESADSIGNVQGRFAYTNEAGNHDLSYIAGSSTGFVATGGSLATPNGLGLGAPSPASTLSTPIGVVVARTGTQSEGSSELVGPNTDGSYSFSYNTGISSHQQSADAAGNVQGRFAYTNDAGNHDLSYTAGSSTGFVATGGSLAVPNGLGQGDPTVAAVPETTVYTATDQPSSVNSGEDDSEDDQANTGDASYSFTVDTDEYKRQETSDAAGNVQGSFQFKNAQGTHDLSFVAGSQTGFQPTSGSLSNAPGLSEEQLKSGEVNAKASAGSSGSTISTGLIAPSVRLPIINNNALESTDDDQANTGDASYSFSIDTNDYKRQEVSDASGNVQGRFSYKNSAGNHDLSYVAGSSTGFVGTGGSLKDAPGLTEDQLRSGETTAKARAQSISIGNLAPGVISSRIGTGDDQGNTDDASYSFNINTDTYTRHESSDAAGNVQGSYEYKNPAGSHSLSFVAGSSTGFQPIGGSLANAPGLTDLQLKSGATSSDTVPVSNAYFPPQVPTLRDIAPPTLPSAAVSPISYKVGDIASVKTYLPPGDSGQKFGYIYDTK